MNIYLARHAQTDWELEDKTMGHTDIPLNRTGRKQARLMADALEKLDIKRVFSSDLLRASETALFTAQRYGLEPIKDVRLRERDLPDEPYQDACTRWKEVFNEIVAPLYGDIFVVAHDGPVRFLVSKALGILPREVPTNAGFFDLDNCGITHLEWNGAGWKTKVLNGEGLKKLTDKDREKALGKGRHV